MQNAGLRGFFRSGLSTVRAPGRPDAATVNEAGFPELRRDGLVGFFGPTGMPLELRTRIAAHVRAGVTQLDFCEKLAATSQVVNAGGPSEFEAAMRDQRDRLAVAAKDLGFTVAQ